MACPYFLPDEPDPAGEANGRPRPPLGRFHAGRCVAGSARTPLPLERCNLGYARGLACFAPSCEADASRFSIGKDNGDTITPQNWEDWPATQSGRPGAVTITYQAGMMAGSPPVLEEAAIIAGIKLVLADLWDNRSGGVIGTRSSAPRRHQVLPSASNT